MLETIYEPDFLRKICKIKDNSVKEHIKKQLRSEKDTIAYYMTLMRRDKNNITHMIKDTHKNPDSKT